MGNLNGSAKNNAKNTPTPATSLSPGIVTPVGATATSVTTQTSFTSTIKNWWNAITSSQYVLPLRGQSWVGYTEKQRDKINSGANKPITAGQHLQELKKLEKDIAAANNKDPKQKKLPPPNPSEYDWNLPPHRWSLPLSSQTVNNIENQEPFGVRGEPHDAYRRGRIWWKANYGLDINYGKDKKSVKLGQGDNDRKIGFQFLWNPETFGTQVAVQMEAVPQPADIFLGVSGAFPATEVISFNIRIDRTNDFACAAARVPRPRLQDNTFNLIQYERGFAAGDSTSAARYILTDSIGKERVTDLKEFYSVSGGFFYYGDRLEQKIADLLNYGTIADIEYLYSAINGKGPGNGKPWINGRGRKTADIGFLMPTLLHVDIGPLSYEGYVTNLNVNHIAFTPDMVPIRTDVSFSMNLLATVTLSNSEE